MAYSVVFLYQIAITVFFKWIDYRSNSTVMDILYIFLPVYVPVSQRYLAESKLTGSKISAYFPSPSVAPLQNSCFRIFSVECDSWSTIISNIDIVSFTMFASLVDVQL